VSRDLAAVVAAFPPAVRVANEHGAIFTLVEIEGEGADRLAILLDQDGFEVGLPIDGFLAFFHLVPSP